MKPTPDVLAEISYYANCVAEDAHAAYWFVVAGSSATTRDLLHAKILDSFEELVALMGRELVALPDNEGGEE